mmetsp:Transcript_12418/g.30344  ORF Transcript_12418/g.30344 Transcript_12418/m.30344 type:complete len:148 (-) Transcript_12418:283-726(-)
MAAWPAAIATDSREVDAYAGISPRSAAAPRPKASAIRGCRPPTPHHQRAKAGATMSTRQRAEEIRGTRERKARKVRPREAALTFYLCSSEKKRIAQPPKPSGGLDGAPSWRRNRPTMNYRERLLEEKKERDREADLSRLNASVYLAI